jgi:hypothetical protein
MSSLQGGEGCLPRSSLFSPNTVTSFERLFSLDVTKLLSTWTNIFQRTSNSFPCINSNSSWQHVENPSRTLIQVYEAWVHCTQKKIFQYSMNFLLWIFKIIIFDITSTQPNRDSLCTESDTAANSYSWTAFVPGSWKTVKMNLLQEVHEQSTCKRICPSECQLTSSILHGIVILWVGISCCPIGEYPTFLSDITQADTHLLSYTVYWTRRSQYKQTFTASEITHTFASWTTHCCCPVKCPPCIWMECRRNWGLLIFNFQKAHSKATVHAGPSCFSWLNSSSSRTVILHCDAIRLLSIGSTSL